MAYSMERRAAVLKKLEPPDAVPLRQLALPISRAQWCDPAQASMATTQGGWAAKNSSSFARVRRLRNTTWPAASAPCAWKPAARCPARSGWPVPRTPPLVVGRHRHLGIQMPSGGVHPIKVAPRRSSPATTSCAAFNSASKTLNVNESRGDPPDAIYWKNRLSCLYI